MWLFTPQGLNPLPLSHNKWLLDFGKKQKQGQLQIIKSYPAVMFISICSPCRGHPVTPNLPRSFRVGSRTERRTHLNKKTKTENRWNFRNKSPPKPSGWSAPRNTQTALLCSLRLSTWVMVTSAVSQLEEDGCPSVCLPVESKNTTFQLKYRITHAGILYPYSPLILQGLWTSCFICQKEKAGWVSR